MVYEYWRAKYAHSELARERALKLATEARLASLESRIHPHFLFNTLNSISALIHIDPVKADEQLQRLSGLLRFALDSAETPQVALGREVKIVQDYLEIEKTRFGERLRITVSVAEELWGLTVPPLAIQTLVENSVKHVIAPSRAGGEVRVSGEWAAGRLRIVVDDGGPGVAGGALPAGRGLDNLRARLQVLYGDGARLEFLPGRVVLEVPA
jgi:LytS/YehU family sensor histidine kinase